MPEKINENTPVNTTEKETAPMNETDATVPAQEYGDVVIRLNHVTKQFKLFKSKKSRLISLFSKRVNYTINTANDDLTFEIRRGESVAFLGKNGAGKSTLLKMITGVLFPMGPCSGETDGTATRYPYLGCFCR